MVNESSAHKRTSHTQLPSSREMSQIAAAEMQRSLPPGKAGVHYVKFEAIEALCEQLGLATRLFESGDKAPETILAEGAKLVDELVVKIMKEPPAGRTLTLLNEAYQYLAQEDEPQVSDLIFVFGGRTPLRIGKAIELYQHHLAPTLLVSGRGPSYDSSSGTTEARQYAQAAMAAGVPESAIWLEEESITLVDNIRRSLSLLETVGKELRSLIVVNSPYTQRRGWAMWRKYLADDVRLYRVNGGTGPNFAAEAWYRNEDGIRVVLGEFVKLRNAVAFDSV